MHSTPFGLLHIEYCFAPTGTLDYLKFWCSVTRGRWLLACEYRMSASISHSAGARFENGYQSDGLAHILDFVMQHQNLFLCPADHGRQGLLQICTPTEEESTAAAASVKDAVDFLNSAIAEPSVALPLSAHKRPSDMFGPGETTENRRHETGHLTGI